MEPSRDKAKRILGSSSERRRPRRPSCALLAISFTMRLSLSASWVTTLDASKLSTVETARKKSPRLKRSAVFLSEECTLFCPKDRSWPLMMKAATSLLAGTLDILCGNRAVLMDIALLQLLGRAAVLCCISSSSDPGGAARARPMRVMPAAKTQRGRDADMSSYVLSTSRHERRRGRKQQADARPVVANE